MIGQSTLVLRQVSDMGGIADGNFPALDAAAEALFEPWRWDAAADGEIGQARLFGDEVGTV